MRSLSILVLCLLGFGTPLSAQLNRSFLSTAGNDANACTAAAPCRTFDRAISQTNAGGEVLALDSGGYGTFTIDKSVNVIAAPGVHAAISALTFGNAIDVIAGTTDVVVVRNLHLNGHPGVSPNAGIDVTSVGALHVEGCTISNFGTIGIEFLTTDTASLYVSGTVVRNSNSVGIVVGAIAGTATAWINDTQSLSGLEGYRVGAGGAIVVTDSVAAENLRGFASACGGAGCSMVMERSTSMNNQIGIWAGDHGAAGTILVSNSVIVGNVTGIEVESDQSVLSRGNNTLQLNGTDGAFSGTFPAD